MPRSKVICVSEIQLKTGPLLVVNMHALLRNVCCPGFYSVFLFTKKKFFYSASLKYLCSLNVFTLGHVSNTNFYLFFMGFSVIDQQEALHI